MSSQYNSLTSSVLAFERKFADRYIQLASVTEDELSATFSVDERFKGEAVMLNFIGTLEARDQLNEFERLQFSFIDHSNRMMTPEFFYVATPVDCATTWQMIADPSSDSRDALG